MAQPVINRKIIFLMASLGIYGILLIVISNKNISPYAYIMNFYSGEASPTSVSVTGQFNNTWSTGLTRSLGNVTRPGGATNLTPTAPLPPSSEPNFDVPNKPILTLFTTFKNTPTKEHIYKNTIHNWALLQPYVKPVMYVIPGEFCGLNVYSILIIVTKKSLIFFTAIAIFAGNFVWSFGKLPNEADYLK